MRMNELISGVRADVAMKLYGDDLSAGRGPAPDRGSGKAVPGAADVKMEQLSTGCPC
jgi:cobalt-zinc-cadmium resistance protein CzcA